LRHAILLYGMLLLPNLLAAQTISVARVSGQSDRSTYNLSFSAPIAGTYKMIFKNGFLGPWMATSCAGLVDLAQRQCVFDNLVEQESNQLSRLQVLSLSLNGQKVRNLNINRSLSYIEIPVELLASNQLQIIVQGFATSVLDIKVEKTSGQNEAPKAYFTASKLSGKTPLDIQFDASPSFDANGDALTFEWDFGDGARASGKIIRHRYFSAGNFQVTLRAIDSRGLSG
jgi:hypothetical protein